MVRTYEQAEQLTAEFKALNNGKMDEAEESRVHFLLVRGADEQKVKELFLSRELFNVHWAHLITDFSGLQG